MLAVKQWNVRNGLRLLNITRWVQQFRNSIEYKYNIIEQKWSEGFLLILAAFPDKIILFQFFPQVETRAGSKVYDSDVLWLEQEIFYRTSSLDHRTSLRFWCFKIEWWNVSKIVPKYDLCFWYFVIARILYFTATSTTIPNLHDLPRCCGWVWHTGDSLISFETFYR